MKREKTAEITNVGEEVRMTPSCFTGERSEWKSFKAKGFRKKKSDWKYTPPCLEYMWSIWGKKKIKDHSDVWLQYRVTRSIKQSSDWLIDQSIILILLW